VEENARVEDGRQKAGEEGIHETERISEVIDLSHELDYLNMKTICYRKQDIEDTLLDLAPDIHPSFLSSKINAVRYTREYVQSNRLHHKTIIKKHPVNPISPSFSNHIVRPATGAMMPMPRAGSTTTGMAASPHGGLLDNNLVAVLLMQEERNERSPQEEDRLHNAKRKVGLQHRAGLIYMQRQIVIRAEAKLAERAQ
jgi:hypothetical protein